MLSREMLAAANRMVQNRIGRERWIFDPGDWGLILLDGSACVGRMARRLTKIPGKARPVNKTAPVLRGRCHGQAIQVIASLGDNELYQSRHSDVAIVDPGG